MISLFNEIINHIQWTGLIYAMLAVCLGAFLQGVTGLGLGMVAAPVMLMVNPIFVPGPLLVLAVLVSSLIVIREWKSIDVKGLSIALSGRIVGSVAAASLLTAIPGHIYGLVFGITIIGLIFISSTRWRIYKTNNSLAAMGILSGIMGTLTSVGAPPIALAYQHESATIIRPTLAGFFLIGSAISIIALYFFGEFTSKHLFVSLLFIPALLLGFHVSNLFVTRINLSLIRYVIFVISGISSLILIAQSIYSIV